MSMRKRPQPLGRRESNSNWEVSSGNHHYQNESKTEDLGLQPSATNQTHAYRNRHRDLETIHTAFRVPLHVPDKRYQEFLLGTRKRRRRPLLSRTCCANFCTGFSVVAVCFLVFVGIILDTQPLYIKGVLPKQIVQIEGQNKPSTRYTIETEGRLPMASSAYHAALFYVFIILVCFYMKHPRLFHPALRHKASQYEDIPDDASSGYLPQYENAQPSVINKMSLFTRQWLLSKGLYSPSKKRKYTQKTG